MSKEEELIDAIRFHEQDKINQFLNDKHLNINYVKDNKSILMYALEECDIETIKKVLALGANINFSAGSDDRPNKAYSVLQTAILLKRIDLVKLLDSYGVDTKESCPYDGSYLNCAIRAGQLEIVKWLVEEKGHDVNAESYGLYPFNCSINHGHPEIILYLRAKDATFNYNLFSQINSDYCSSIILLLTGKKIDVNATIKVFQAEYSLLTMAVKSGHWKIARLVYEKGGKHIANQIALPNNCLLYFAVISGSLKTVQWALSIPEFKKDVHFNTTYKFMGNEGSITPLGCASHNHSNDIVKFLIKQGALINPNNKYMDASMKPNPLAEAYQSNNLDTAQLLFDLGANRHLGHPHWLWEIPIQEWQLTYFCAVNFIKPKLIKLLAGFIDIEYFSKTNDILRKEKPTLLKNLIERVAHHTENLIMLKYQTAIKEGLLKVIQTVHKDKYELNRRYHEDRMKKFQEEKTAELLIAVKKILSRRVINRLEEILIQPPYFIMEPYLNYLFYAQSKNVTARDLNKNLCQGGIESTIFWKKVNQFLPEQFSLFSLFEDLNNKENTEFASYLSYETSKAQVVNLKEQKEEKELKETKEGKEVKESKENKEHHKIDHARVLKFAEKLNQQRYELANRISQKCLNAQRKESQPNKNDSNKAVILKSKQEQAALQKTSLSFLQNALKRNNVDKTIKLLFEEIDTLSEEDREFALMNVFKQGISRSSKPLLLTLTSEISKPETNVENKSSASKTV